MEDSGYRKIGAIFHSLFSILYSPSSSSASLALQPVQMLLGPGDQVLLAGEQLLDRRIDVFGRGYIALLLIQLAQPQVDDSEVWVGLAGVGLDEVLRLLDRDLLIDDLVDPRLGALDAGRPRPGVWVGPDLLDLHIATMRDIGVARGVELLVADQRLEVFAGIVAGIGIA